MDSRSPKNFENPCIPALSPKFLGAGSSDCLEFVLSNVHFKLNFESIEFGLIESQCDHFQLAYGMGHETQAHQGPPPREGTVAPFMFESEYCACTSPALFVRLCFGSVIVIPRPLR